MVPERWTSPVGIPREVGKLIGQASIASLLDRCQLQASTDDANGRASISAPPPIGRGRSPSKECLPVVIVVEQVFFFVKRPRRGTTLLPDCNTLTPDHRPLTPDHFRSQRK